MTEHDSGHLEAVGRLVHEARRRSLFRAMRGDLEEVAVTMGEVDAMSMASTGLPQRTILWLTPYLRNWEELEEFERGLCLDMAAKILDQLSDR